jgi:hypothetical protein
VVFLKRNLSGRALEMLQRAVAGYTVEEAPQGSPRRIILFRVSHQGHKNVLHNFLRGPSVPAHAQSKAVERRLVATVKEGKSLLVALAGAPEQHVISFLVRDAHLSR